MAFARVKWQIQWRVKRGEWRPDPTLISGACPPPNVELKVMMDWVKQNAHQFPEPHRFEYRIAPVSEHIPVTFYIHTRTTHDVVFNPE